MTGATAASATLGTMAGTAAGVAATAPAVPALAALASAGGEAGEKGVAALLAALDAFFRLSRAREDAWILQQIASRSRDDAMRVIAEENQRRAEFERRVRARVQRDATKALGLGTPAERLEALQKLLQREQVYARQRAEALATRSLALADRLTLRVESPSGAFWKLGRAEKHTPDCLAMAGKFWPWEVLDDFHPPTHTGCKCSLHGYAVAVASGWMRPEDVMDVSVARVKAAAAKALLHEEQAGELGEALVKAGIVPDLESYDRALWASATGRSA